MRFWWFMLLAACGGDGCRGCDRPEPDDTSEPCSDPDTWYTDADGDAHGDPASSVEACTQPDQTVSSADDCDDQDGAVWAEATAFVDEDGDGFGTSAELICGLPAGFAAIDGDCDDQDSAVSPGVEPICGNDQDDDCDGLSDCEAPLGEDPSTLTPVVLSGMDGGAFGAGLYAGDDIDGDGTLDLGVGATALDEVGAAYLFLGPLDAREASTADHVYVGPVEEGEAGAAMGVADFDEDGSADLVVSVPGGGSTARGGATLYVVFGPLSASGELVSGDTVGAIRGCDSRSLIADDLAGTDKADLLVGNAVGLSTFTGPIRAEAEYDEDLIDGFLATNIYEGGQSVARVGDVTGDGVADILLGAPEGSHGHFEDEDRQYAGNAYLLDDTSDLTENAGSEVAASEVARVTLVGEHTDALLGAAITPAGDLDGDGLADILVGSPGFALNVVDLNSGAAYIWYGSKLMDTEEGDVLFAEEGRAKLFVREAEYRMGATVAGGADLNGDATPDIAVGVPGYDDGAGAVAVWYGPVSGEQELEDADLLITGDGSDAFGSTLHIGGDYNGVGWDDLIVGAPGVSGGDGAVYLFGLDRW